MKIINRKNIIPVLGCTYTAISLCNALTELIFGHVNENEALNCFTILCVSAIAILVLSLQNRLRSWNIWLVMLIQYIMFITMVMFSLWILHFFVHLHPNGYHDMFISCTFFFFIGAVIYYVTFFMEIGKENQMLGKIKDSAGGKE